MVSTMPLPLPLLDIRGCLYFIYHSVLVWRGLWRSISCPTVLIELVFRLELGLCCPKIALEQEHGIKCFNRAVVNYITHHQEGQKLMKF